MSRVSYAIATATAPLRAGRISVSRGSPLPVAVITINSPPVNSLSLDLWSELLAALERAERDPAVRGAIFVSALDGIDGRGKRPIFTAGNDIHELLATDTSCERYVDFWTTSNVFLARLLKSPLVTIAAVRGACPAGGTCLALCCDYRILTDDSICGLNEVALGINVPRYWAMQMIRVIGYTKAALYLNTATMFNAHEALELGYAHEVISTKDKQPQRVSVDLRVAAERAAFTFLIHPDPGRIITKQNLVGDFVDVWMDEDRLRKEAKLSYGFLALDSTVSTLSAYLHSLGDKKSSKM